MNSSQNKTDSCALTQWCHELNANKFHGNPSVCRKMSNCWCLEMKSQGITKVSTGNDECLSWIPLETLNICTKFNGNLPNLCQDISVVDWLTDPQTQFDSLCLTINPSHLFSFVKMGTRFFLFLSSGYDCFYKLTKEQERTTHQFCMLGISLLLFRFFWKGFSWEQLSYQVGLIIQK